MFFGDSVAYNSGLAFDVVRVMISEHVFVDDIDTPQIKIKKQGVAFSVDFMVLSEQLMSQVVTAYNIKERKPRYSPLSPHKLMSELKRNAPEKASKYIPENSYVEIKNDMSLYLPLRHPDFSVVATVISSDYMDDESRSAKFYSAMSDLSMVNMIPNTTVVKRSAFLIKPQGVGNIDKNVLSKINKDIERFVYQAEDRKFNVIACDDSEEFFEQAVAWCE